jgi:hypothetical protein
MAKKRKPVKLRDNIRTDSLDISKTTRVRKEFIDYDPKFLKKLKREDPEAYLYLAAFVDEYENAGIKKNSNGTVAKGYLHNTKVLAKERYDANNHRNNDVMGVTKANYLLSNIDNEIKSNDGWYINRGDLAEDAMIASIDSKAEDILTYEEYQLLKHKMTEEMIIFYECLYAED